MTLCVQAATPCLQTVTVCIQAAHVDAFPSWAHRLTAYLHHLGGERLDAWLMPSYSRIIYKHARPACAKRRLGGATAGCPGRLGGTALGLGCFTHSGGAPVPLRSQQFARGAVVRPCQGRVFRGRTAHSAAC